MVAPVQSRRARLRAETSAEIKAIALDLMAAGGPGAITLRAIAREMGMTPNAIYGYFATRDDLVGALIADVHTALAETLEAARDAEPAGDPARRLLAWAKAYRAWALSSTGAFRLIYGDAVLGCQTSDGGPVIDAEHRACLGLIGLTTANWPDIDAVPGSRRSRWSDFDPGLVAAAREQLPGVRPAAIALAIRIWARMHGLVSLEIYGHLANQVRDPARLYLAEMQDLFHALGQNEAAL